MAVHRPLDELQRSLEQTLIPSPSVTELDPDTLGETISRLAAVAGDAGERYHLASALTATTMDRLADLESAAFVRQWYFTTAADGARALAEQGSTRVLPAAALDPALAFCVAPFTDPVPSAATLFGVDVVVTHDRGLWKVVPGTGALTFEGTFDPGHAERVAAACRVWSPDADVTATSFVFVVGPFARSSYLSGARGYRQALLAAGAVLGHLASRWEAYPGDHPLLAVHDTFVDRVVDEVLRNDGVERGALAVVGLTRHATPDAATVPAPPTPPEEDPS